VHINSVYLQWQSETKLPTFLKRTETSVIQIVFQDVLYHVRACSVTVSCCSHSMAEKLYILVSNRI